MNNNTLLIDQKYASMLASRLERFKNKGRGIFNCRCPICKDSAKDKKKTRFYIYPKDGKYMAYCQNCGYSHLFGVFLKEFDPGMYADYNLERFKELGGHRVKYEVEEEVKPKFSVDMTGLKKISSLHHNHPAKVYITGRQIPANLHYKLFFTEHFGRWINQSIPGKMEAKSKFDPRIVFFMYDREGNITGCQGRSINPKSKLRYITIRFDEAFPKVFGLDTFDPNFKSRVLEGPIDSMFLENCLAMAGSDVSIKELVRVSNINLKRTVFVYDNEPRNAEVVGKMEKAINEGLNICIWPSSIKYKDVNDMIIKQGLTAKHIESIIDTNTFSGLTAKLQLNMWRKDK